MTKKLTISTYHATRESKKGIGKFVFALKNPLLEIACRKAIPEIDHHKAHIERVEKAHREETVARKRVEDDFNGRTTFISGVIHDLKNPVTVIKGVTQMLKESVGDDPMFNDMLTLIQNSEVKLLNTINWTLDVAQADAGHLKPKFKVVDISSEIKEAIDCTKSLAEKKKLEFTLENHHPVYANLDPRLLHHILMNLITNAIKYTHDGSVKVIVKHEKGNAIVRICDTGIGIKDCDLATIFHEYKRGEGTDQIDGRGLGLALAKRFAELMKGHISVYSQEGRGSTFKISFPAASKPRE